MSVVKHLERFPSDGLTGALRNVFDFDAHRHEDLQAVATILERYGVALPQDLTAYHRSSVRDACVCVCVRVCVGRWVCRSDACLARVCRKAPGHVTHRTHDDVYTPGVVVPSIHPSIHPSMHAFVFLLFRRTWADQRV